MTDFRTLLHHATRLVVVRRATLTALIVGTVLVAINQGANIWSGRFDLPCAGKCCLTFLVPYCVSTVSHVLALMDQCSRPRG